MRTAILIAAVVSCTPATARIGTTIEQCEEDYKGKAKKVGITLSQAENIKDGFVGVTNYEIPWGDITVTLTVFDGDTKVGQVTYQSKKPFTEELFIKLIKINLPRLIPYKNSPTYYLSDAKEFAQHSGNTITVSMELPKSTPKKAESKSLDRIKDL